MKTMRQGFYITLLPMAFIAVVAPLQAADGSTRQQQTATVVMGVTDMPARGLSMKQVRKRYGKPQKVISPSGHFSKRRPPITRWVYSNFIVYFENRIVLHSVRPRSVKFRRPAEKKPPTQAPVAKTAPDKPPE